MSVIPPHYFLLKTITTTLHYVGREREKRTHSAWKKNKNLADWREDTATIARLHRINSDKQQEIIY